MPDAAAPDARAADAAHSQPGQPQATAKTAASKPPTEPKCTVPPQAARSHTPPHTRRAAHGAGPAPPPVFAPAGTARTPPPGKSAAWPTDPRRRLPQRQDTRQAAGLCRPEPTAPAWPLRAPGVQYTLPPYSSVSPLLLPASRRKAALCVRRITGFCIRRASEPHPRCIRTASKLYPFCPHAKSCRTPTWERQLLCIVFSLYRCAFYGGQFSYTTPPAG